MTTEYQNIIGDLLLRDPLESMLVKLTPLETIMALNIPFKGYKNLTNSQRIMLMQSIKLAALKELEHKTSIKEH